jgi:hypothetical protein
MKRSTALIRPSRTATQHSFTWQSHRIGTASELTRGSQSACDRWRFLRWEETMQVELMSDGIDRFDLETHAQAHPSEADGLAGGSRPFRLHRLNPDATPLGFDLP